MDLLRNVFSRIARKEDIYYTVITVLKPDAFHYFNKRTEIVEFTDMSCRNSSTIKPSVKNAHTSTAFWDYRVSPLKELRIQKQAYTQEDFDRIAEMFLVSYTHCTSEDELPNYQTKISQKNANRGRKFFQQIRKIIS